MKILKLDYFLGIGGKSHGAMTGQRKFIKAEIRCI